MYNFTENEFNDQPELVGTTTLSMLRTLMKSLDVIHDDSFLNTVEKSDVSFVGTKSFIPVTIKVSMERCFSKDSEERSSYSANMSPNKN